ncbi:hypothetical protein R3P38DRAFT_2781368 [Favolaschia claudopus]|uniref:Uncharacterized protein n=1 Tax=Favolaschia claudopus TaxID=2862362 RepID=A0AAW0B592_9AGAR
MTFRDDAGCRKNAPDSRIFDVILATAPRWRSLKLNVPSSKEYQIPSHPSLFLDRLAGHSLDSLEELNFILGDDNPVILFGSASQLRKLSLQLNHQEHLPEMALPWAQLVNLTLDFQYSTEPGVEGHCFAWQYESGLIRPNQAI